MLSVFRCLSLKGPALAPDIEPLIIFAALEMMEEGAPTAHYMGGDFEIEMTTSFKETALESFCGTEFTARVEGMAGTTELRFILNSVSATICAPALAASMFSSQQYLSMN